MVGIDLIHGIDSPAGTTMMMAVNHHAGAGGGGAWCMTEKQMHPVHQAACIRARSQRASSVKYDDASRTISSAKRHAMTSTSAAGSTFHAPYASNAPPHPQTTTTIHHTPPRCCNHPLQPRPLHQCSPPGPGTLKLTTTPHHHTHLRRWAASLRLPTRHSTPAPSKGACWRRTTPSRLPPTPRHSQRHTMPLGSMPPRCRLTSRPTPPTPEPSASACKCPSHAAPRTTSR